MQVDALRAHYVSRGRPEAVRNLTAVLIEAATRIEAHPERGLPAPRLYPELRRPGRHWLKVRAYWIAYGGQPLVILGVFHETTNIPRRV